MQINSKLNEKNRMITSTYSLALMKQQKENSVILGIIKLVANTTLR